MNNKPDKKDYLYKGITAFCVIAASILFFLLIYKIDSVKKFLTWVLGVLAPVIFGLVIAYILNPVVDFFNSKFTPLFSKKAKSEEKARKTANVFSVIISMIVFALIIAGIFVLVIPQLIVGISNIIEILPDKIDRGIKWGEKFLKQNKDIQAIYEGALHYGKDWLQTDLTDYVSRLAEGVASGVMGVLNFLKNFVIGYMIAIYLLYNKRNFGNRARKMMFAFFGDESVRKILIGLHKSNSVFSGFIIGKIIDSFIIGVLCFIGATILKIPYTMLVSVIVGVTNIIPVFGPYIGGIPCVILVFVTNPIKGIYFGIFVILLQLLDGNVIGPKILGDKTGLETFWVIFAIIVGGGMFGVVGMIIGVPAFAVIYYFISYLVSSKLKAKNLSTDSEDYSAELCNAYREEGITDEEEENN